MPDYQLYCFAQSGNAYRAALMLNLVGANWKPIWVDFFQGLVQRTPQFRAEVNEMGEAPVLMIDGDRKITQSPVIIDYLARHTGRYQPQGEDEQMEAMRWMFFDVQKVNGFLGPYRFLKNWAKPAPHESVLAFLKGRIDGNLAIVNKRLEKAPFLLGDRPTIADISMCAYLFYPPEEYGFDIRKNHPAISVFLDRIMKLSGWAHPYDLMPGYPFGTQLLNGKPAA